MNMQQYIKSTENLIKYFVNLCQIKLMTLYAQDTNLIATYLEEHPEKKQKFYGELIANAVNLSKNALGTENGNLFILFNSVINYDPTFMCDHSLIGEMRERLDLLYCTVTVFNCKRKNIDESDIIKYKSMDDECIKIYEAFISCVNYYYCFFKPSFNPLP